MSHGTVTSLDLLKFTGTLLLIMGLPALILIVIANLDKVKEFYDKVKQSSIMVSLVLNSFTGILLFSILGVLVNLAINNATTQYQFGITRHIDTTLLTDYKWVRNLFIVVGIIAGFVSTLVNWFKGFIK